jgi:hypothetical protein
LADGPQSLAAGSDEFRVKNGKAGAPAPEIGMAFGILLPGDCPNEPGKRVRQLRRVNGADAVFRPALFGWKSVVGAALFVVAAAGRICHVAGGLMASVAPALPSGAARIVEILRVFGFSGACDRFADNAGDDILRIVVSIGAADETE